MHTQGAVGGAIKPECMIDIDTTHSDKKGNSRFEVKITNVGYLPSSNYNLFSLSRLLAEGWTMQEDGNAITMTKGKRAIIFDIVIHTAHGALFCACFKRRDAETCGSIVENETKISVPRHMYY